MFARLAVDASDRDPGMTLLAPVFAFIIRSCREKNTLKIHTKSRLLSLLHESKYVEEIDPQQSTFHKIQAT